MPKSERGSEQLGVPSANPAYGPERAGAHLLASEFGTRISDFGFGPTSRPMKLLLKLIPWFFVALFGSEIAALLAPKKDGEFHVREFGRLPVLMNGRIQPFDSIGRNTL